MDSVIRGVVVFVVLLLIFRIAGRRTLAQSSPFELVLLLIISETVQEALVDDDQSLTNALLLVLTLVGASIALSVVKHRWPRAGRWLEGRPVVIVRDGVPDREGMDRERVDEGEILTAARSGQGLETMDQIKHAVLEENGDISVVPRK